MNSSGIKRGLAATAVAALAVTGIPALASSASAAPGDVLQVGSVGPVRNGGTEGGVVVLKTNGVAPANIRLVATNLTGAGSATVADPNQSVTIVSASPAVANGAPGDSDPTDGLAEITLRLAVTTPSAGGAFSVVAYEEEGGTTGVDASEPRATVSGTTSGPVSSLEISPATQTAPANTPSGDYTLTLRDSAGRLTQLTGVEAVAVTAPGASVSDASITAADAPDGTGTFTAEDSTPGAYIITANGPNSSQTTATLQVVAAAGALDEDDIDIVTAADGWTGFGGGAYDENSQDVPVRVDQTSIKLDIRSNNPADAGGVVAVQITGGGITFGGKSTATLTTTLDANGRGSLTITPDAGSVQEGDTIDIDGQGLNLQLDFERGTLTEVNAEAETYVSKLDGSVDITVVATDQFGLPVAGAYVDARRAGANNDAAPTAKKVTDANGEATFTFTDVSAANNQTDTVTFRVFQDQFAALPTATDTATIRYTTEGTGSDYVLNLDGINASGTAYNPASVSVIPLTDTDAGAAGADAPAGDEVVNLDIVGGDTGAPSTVTVDNGALILTAGETRLAQGSASESIVLPDTGANALRIVGTKSGLVTVTVVSGGRTKTAQFTVSAQNNVNKARNVSVDGPESVDAGGLATFTATVTDAFGNPVAGFPAAQLNVQVSGPGALQDTGAVTDATGKVALNVRVADDAGTDPTVGTDVTVRVQGFGAQFGAAADQETSASAPGAAAGLTASQNVDEATVTVTPPLPPEKEEINLQLKGSNNGKKADKLTANANANAAGLTVVLMKGKKQIDSATLNRSGDAFFTVKDTNGKKSTTYKVKVAGTDVTKAGKATKSVK